MTFVCILYFASIKAIYSYCRFFVVILQWINSKGRSTPSLVFYQLSVEVCNHSLQCGPWLFVIIASSKDSNLPWHNSCFHSLPVTEESFFGNPHFSDSLAIYTVWLRWLNSFCMLHTQASAWNGNWEKWVVIISCIFILNLEGTGASFSKYRCLFSVSKIGLLPMSY